MDSFYFMNIHHNIGLPSSKTTSTSPFQSSGPPALTGWHQLCWPTFSPYCEVREIQETPNPISLSSYFLSAAGKPCISASNGTLVSAPVPQNIHSTRQPERGRSEMIDGIWEMEFKWESGKRFCLVRGNTSMGGSCINRWVEHLDMYHKGWQVLDLDKTLNIFREI